MANEEGPQAPPTTQGAQDPPAPQNPPLPQNLQIPLVPNAPQVPQALQVPQQPAPNMPLLNWSHFKPEFSRNQTKMLKLIYLGQMIGWTHIDFRTMSKYKDSA